MKDTIKYYNHNGVLQLTLNQYPYYSELSDLKDWAIGYNEQFGQMNTFRSNKKTYALFIGIAGDSKTQRDRILDIFMADVLVNEPGFLELNGWQLPCYITSATHGNAQNLDRKNEYVVTSPTSIWVRKQTKSYNGVPGGGGALLNLGRDYSYDEGVLGRGYNYGYSAAESHYASIDLPGIDNGFEAIIYGAVVNPVIYLNNQPVQVNVTLTADERLQIISNGRVKTIKILSPSGVETDAFVYRDKEHTPFLTLGQHTDLTYGQIRFDFTTIERRVSSTWT